MSDGSLSQDEIDALLQGADDIQMDNAALGTAPSGTAGFDGGGLSQPEISAFQELINKASSNEGATLEAMFGKKVVLSNPRIELVSFTDIQSQLPDPVVESKMDYENGIIGEHAYFLSVEGASIIAGLMMGQDKVDLSEQSLSAISEVLNVMTGNASTTIGTQIKSEIRTAPPQTNQKSKNDISISPSTQYLKVIYDFDIEGLSKIQLIEVFAVSIVKDLTSGMVPASNTPTMGQPNMTNQPNMAMGQPNMMNQPSMIGQPNINAGNMPTTQVQNAQFQSFNNVSYAEQESSIGLLMDVSMELTVELGRTKKPIKDILGMGEGTVIELDKLAGEPVDILVNGKLIARGEVVVIDEKFGVRVTEIINPMSRVNEIN